MVVRKPGNLFYYKDEDVTQEPSGQVDLTLVVNFTLKEKDDNEKGSAAGTIRLDLDLADRVLKLRSSYLFLCSSSVVYVDSRLRKKLLDGKRAFQFGKIMLMIMVRFWLALLSFCSRNVFSLSWCGRSRRCW